MGILDRKSVKIIIICWLLGVLLGIAGFLCFLWHYRGFL